MIPLDIVRINEFAPYKVEFEDGQYLFETDHSVQYGVSFDEDVLSDDLLAYWFNLANRNQKVSPSDPKIRNTIVFILEEFFRSNPDILLYMCDTANNQQSMRSRLFLRWFNAYGKQQEYYTRTEIIEDEGEQNYVAIIVKRTHPRLKDIIDLFDEQITLFQSQKP